MSAKRFTLLSAAFQQERKYDLMESLGYVDGDIFDAVLHGAVLQFGELLLHLTAVGIGHLGGL